MAANAIDYSAADAEIRADLHAAHQLVLEHFARPGNWFTGAQRSAIVREARLATRCPKCRERKAALSPEHASGEHLSTRELRPALADLIHRIRTDPGRLSRGVYERTLAAGLSVGEYVEAVGLVALSAGIDSSCRALGIPEFGLLEPLAGEPSQRTPDGLESDKAWVPMLSPESASGPEADLYGGASFVPNIMRALSSVPDHVRVLRKWSDATYVALQDLSASRAIDRMQIELIAARVSALNECFY